MLIGALLGIVLSEVGFYLLHKSYPNFPINVTGTFRELVFGVSAVVGVISGIWPAYRAVRIEPTEEPVSY